jgi:hypothetical protein
LSHASTFKTASVTGGCQINFSGGNTIYVFNGTGTITF